MKTLMLIACLLGVVYASKPQEVKRFHENVAKCVQELNKQPNEAETIYCVLMKQNLIDDQNKYLMEEGFVLLDDIISDNDKRNQAKETIRKCYSQLRTQDNAPEMNKREMIKSIECASNVMTLIDKSE